MVISVRCGQGAYRKPLELLLGLMEEHWSGKKENQQERTFISKCARHVLQNRPAQNLQYTDWSGLWCSVNMVQILTMMEKDVVDGEQEIQTLKETVKTLNSETERQKKQHQDEIQPLKCQLQQAQESIVRLLLYSKESDVSVEIKHKRELFLCYRNLLMFSWRLCWRRTCPYRNSSSEPKRNFSRHD